MMELERIIRDIWARGDRLVERIALYYEYQNFSIISWLTSRFNQAICCTYVLLVFSCIILLARKDHVHVNRIIQGSSRSVPTLQKGLSAIAYWCSSPSHVSIHPMAFHWTPSILAQIENLFPAEPAQNSALGLRGLLLNRGIEFLDLGHGGGGFVFAVGGYYFSVALEDGAGFLSLGGC
jgi:hypothetical protein